MIVKRGFVFIGLALTLLASACSSQDTAVIRFGLSSMPANMDPRYTTDAAATRIGRLIYQRLVDFDENMRPIPAIASWRSRDNQHFVFRLRDDLQFHNGTALTSEDVKATYEYILDKKNASPHRASIGMIETITTPDALTVKFQLNRVDPLFPGYLVIGILPKELMDKKHRFEKQPVGSGPFEFIGWPEEGKMALRRLSDEQRVEFVHVPNPTVRVLKLMRGEIDMLQNDVPPELINYLSEDEQIQVMKKRGSNFAYMGFNLEDPALSDKRVRQAIAHGINRKEIIQYVFGDAARPANGLLPPSHWAGNAQLREYEYNPEKARHLLQKSGYGDRPLPLTYKTSSDPFRIRVATILQSQLAAIGIQMEIRSYDWGTFYGDIKAGRFQLYSLAWIGIKTPDIFRYVVHSKNTPPNGANRGRFSNAEVDALIEQAERQPTLEQQARYYKQLQAVIQNELPYIPLWYEDHVFVANRHISDYTVAPDGNYDGLISARKH